MGTALKGAAREWFLQTEYADGSWEEFEDFFRGRFKNEDAEWRTFKQLRKLRLRKDVEGFLEEVEMVIYEAPSDAELRRMFKLQCVIDALPNELQQWVLHGDPRDAKEAIEKLCSKRKVELGGIIDGRNADIGRRHDSTFMTRTTGTLRPVVPETTDGWSPGGGGIARKQRIRWRSCWYSARLQDDDL